jgi:hypothetical protein
MAYAKQTVKRTTTKTKANNKRVSNNAKPRTTKPKKIRF